MSFLKKILFVFTCCIYIHTNAQFNVLSNVVSKKIATKGTIKLNEKSIVPKSVFVQLYDTSFYTIDYVLATLVWNKPTQVDSVFVTYRTFPFSFTSTQKRFNYDSVKNNFISQPFIFNKNNNDAGALDFGQMNYNGSFGRSLSFGNNQDAVFNSQLNLQITGIIGDSIEIAAAITDNNIPIQPDGTTQQLNEFDKVLLQFKKNSWEINLGDIDLRQNKSYFLNFYKRLQGISYVQQQKISPNIKSNFTISGAIAKGKFARNIFTGQEGNQGPYRLQGNNNEFYLIVLSGTEKIFIDGDLLQRGEDADYVINYNTAEITFTPKRMITKDRRIQVEFEYADRNFLNAMFYANNEIEIGKKLKINLAAYTNADAKNSTINQILDVQQKQFLANLGDDVQNAFYKTAFIDSFSANKILYAKRVNPINPNWDSIYVYTINKDSAKYALNFVDVGVNNGDYINYFNAANGKVYKYIAPINGIKQGNFEAATFLVTPKKQQIFTATTTFAVNKTTTLIADIALSNYDINTFSTKNKNNDKGFASKILVQNIARINKKIQLQTLVGYEYVQQQFKPIERLRAVEFTRDWGLNILNKTATEHLPKLSLQLTDKNNNAIQYNAEGYIRSDDYKAIKQTIQYNFFKNGFSLNGIVSNVNNNTPTNKGNFIRPSIAVSKTFSQLHNYTIGATYALEQNKQKFLALDTITPLSFYFEDISCFIKSDATQKNNFSFTYFTRTNKLPYKKDLLQTDKSHNYVFATELLNNDANKFRANITYRVLQVNNQFLTNLNADNSLLGRAEYLLNKWNGFITASTLYELGAGQEQQRDFSYFEVPAGRGEYAWRDYNADGIPQLNEFEIALYADQAKYIKIFTPTNKYIKANYTQFNYSINLNPKALFNTTQVTGFKKFVSKLYAQSSMQTAKKVLANGNVQLNPFNKNIQDTALIQLSNILSNTIAYNKFSNIWGVDVTNISNYTKALLTYGFESRQLNDWLIKARINFKQQYTFELVQKISTNILATPKFANRNYSIQMQSTEPKLVYTYFTKYRLQASYVYSKKSNAQLYGAETATANILNVEAKYNTANTTSLLAKFSYNKIAYTGNTNTSISYIMLDGLQPGKNFLWNVELIKRLGNNLELSLNYEGRKPAETKVINIGRASIRALL